MFIAYKVEQERALDMKKKLKTALLSVGALVLMIFILLVATFFFWLGPTVKLLAETIADVELDDDLFIAKPNAA